MSLRSGPENEVSKRGYRRPDPLRALRPSAELPLASPNTKLAHPRALARGRSALVAISSVWLHQSTVEKISRIVAPTPTTPAATSLLIALPTRRARCPPTQPHSKPHTFHKASCKSLYLKRPVHSNSADTVMRI